MQIGIKFRLLDYCFLKQTLVKAITSFKSIDTLRT